MKFQRNAGNRDVRVKSWSELNEALYEDAWKPQLARFRSDLAFRGLSNAEGNLSTSLSRLGGDASPQLVNHNHRSRSRRNPA